MNSELKREAMACMEAFGNNVRLTLAYEDVEFDRLRRVLTELFDVLRHDTVIDKDLAGYLYSLPQIIRNMLLSYHGPLAERPELFDRLEDAWVELDALVLDCLHTPAT